ncbi:hypothetical protein KYB31_07905 [Clostridium felsineum]|uniref:hypothetical protein n=1 Tax=Clostridium felsineum TaxID=36839 RepID=UPI00214DB90E|nr:hypothetical protein [Clostridium felsineum]MCR3758913.1 hypothetical protein [Clostridium felsineum]
MYFKYRRLICTTLVFIILLATFLIGKSVGSSKKITINRNETSDKTADKSVDDNNYSSPLTINGDNYSSTVTVSKATITDDGTMNVTVQETDQQNVAGYKVVALDSDNNVLKIQQSSTQDKTFQYTVTYDNDKDKNVILKVYPLTQDMVNNQQNLKLDNLAYGKTKLNIAYIKQQTIDNIKGNGSGNNGSSQ